MNRAKTRKVCAWPAALLIIFAVSFCFLRPAPPKPVLSSLSDEKLIAVLKGYGFDMGACDVEHLRYELGKMKADPDMNSFQLYGRIVSVCQ